MANFLNSAVESLESALRHVRSAFHPSRPWIARVRDSGRSRRVRKIGLIIVAVLLFLDPAAYLAVPPVVRHVLTGPVAGSIHRQVSVGNIRFNLYALRVAA